MAWTECSYTNALLCILPYLVAAVLVYLFVVMVHSGLLTKPRVTFGKMPLRNAKIAYKFELGKYKNVSTYFSEMGKFAPELTKIGIYYDDPSVTEKQRFIVGAVLCEDGAPVYSKLVELFTSHGYKIFDFPDGSQYSCLRSEFPYTTFFSVLFLISRWYPAISKFAERIDLMGEAHPSPYIELYTTDRVIFFAPIERKTDFFVPEAKMKTQ